MQKWDQNGHKNRASTSFQRKHTHMRYRSTKYVYICTNIKKTAKMMLRGGNATCLLNTSRPYALSMIIECTADVFKSRVVSRSVMQRSIYVSDKSLKKLPLFFSPSPP